LKGLEMIVRRVLGALAVTFLAACSPATEKAVKASTGCAQVATRTIALLAPSPDYVVDARSFDGPKPADADAAAVASSNPCANATVALTVRRIDDGAFVHGLVSSMNRMDLIEGHAGPSFDGARLAAFLGAWVKVTVATTDAAPELASGTLTTPLDAAAFAAVRAKKSPMLCYVTSVHERACFSIDAQDPYTLAPFFTEDQS